jgi:peptide-methionine (S)-S-oxide reductase
MLMLRFAVLTLALVFNPLAANTGHSSQQRAEAIFAGGCFWCVEADFDKIPGVVETISGYTGGHIEEPTYQQVSAGGTGHREAVRITYDPNEVTYEALLIAFWHSVDPTDAGGQFGDRGESYKSAIFVLTVEQQAAAEGSIQKVEQALGKAVATTIERAKPFYPAEDYHQNYYEKNPLRYQYYRWGCGRNAQIERVWGEEAFEGIPGHS